MSHQNPKEIIAIAGKLSDRVREITKNRLDKFMDKVAKAKKTTY
jgi:hypothetical protein